MNLYIVFGYGIFFIDLVVVGFGGCLYVKGVSGNVVIEDVLYMLNGMGILIGIDMMKLLKVFFYILEFLGCFFVLKVVNVFLVK